MHYLNWHVVQCSNSIHIFNAFSQQRSEFHSKSEFDKEFIKWSNPKAKLTSDKIDLQITKTSELKRINLLFKARLFVKVHAILLNCWIGILNRWLWLNTDMTEIRLIFS